MRIVIIIVIILKNLVKIMGILLILGFIFPKISKKNNLNNKILNKKTILSESGIYINIFIKLFIGILIVVGALVMYLSIISSQGVFNKIIIILLGLICVIFPSYILIKLQIRCMRIIKGNYVIIEDILKDKEATTSNSSDSTSNGKFYLYFNDYFKKYDKEVSVKKDVFERADIGDEFYLVITKSDCFAFNKKNCMLEEETKVIKIEDISKYININNIDTKNKEIPNNICILTKDKIKKDFKRQGHVKTAIALILISIVLILFLVLFGRDIKELVAIIILSIMIIFLLLFTFVKVKYVFTILKNIGCDKFTIMEDEVVSLNNGVDFKDSNNTISFKFKNYKKIVYASKKSHPNAIIGDKFYLIFVKGDSEPVEVYNEKYTKIDGNISNLIKK